MGIFQTAEEVLKKSFSPKLNWRQTSESVRNTFEKKDPASIAIDVSVDEFKIRYRNLRFTASACLMFFAICIITMTMVENMGEFIFRILASALFGLLYFRYSYIAWVARMAWASGQNLDRPILATGKEFLEFAAADPSVLLPLKLPARGAKKS